ncbi:hypothetical protein [Halorubellus litoreus]|uniref:Uncharacterized protein n=1 Tax=Halorubellus litoreus TaxID=755308 RepID=A0ABD5VKY7_9EURY
MPEFEFGSRDEARGVREEFDEYLCPHDDARMKTVTIVSDAPDRVLDAVGQQAAISRDDHDGTGQLSLTDGERDRFDFSKDGLNVPKLRAIKGVMRDEGVEDWSAFVNPDLTVDEHVALAERAKRDERGDRLDAEDSATEKAARAARSAQSNQCDHARDHCKHGEPEACEFLQHECGMDDDEIDALLGFEDDRDPTEQTDLVTVGGGDFPEMDVEPEVAGALSRSWQGYRSAVGRLSRDLDDVRKAVINARQAFQAINAIRDRHGQDALHPDRLHEELAALAGMPEDIPEVRTLAHFADDGDVVEHDAQRSLSGEHADPQTRLAGGERGEVESEREKHVEENPGGLRVDEREETTSETETTQAKPDAFQVAEGGQETL